MTPLIAFIALAKGGEQVPYRKEIAEARKTLLTLPLSGSDWEMGRGEAEAKARAYRDLFEKVKLSELSGLTLDSDLSLALQAKWESSRKLVPRKPKVDLMSDWVYDAKEVQKFNDFFATRVGYAAPEWWQKANTKAKVFPGRHHAIWSEARVKQNGITVAEDKDTTTITNGTDKVTFHHRYKGMGYHAIFSNGKAYVANYNGTVSYDFDLFCYNVADGKELWKQRVWACRRGGFGGFSYHDVAMEMHGDQIAIFGAEFGSYAEGFRAEDGKPLYKFCSAYWFNFPEEWKLPWNKRGTL